MKIGVFLLMLLVFGILFRPKREIHEAAHIAEGLMEEDSEGGNCEKSAE